ncbi:type VII secretion protein EsaA [Streptococcus chenjunshii]|uniref:Type VII secretion system accessory factor EsaA n=1 Tax=Streptococcus chenjunshii TaxID=2173853 RepID=A0A372KLS5_9STRE|nr:type VII secretion protein EsaA [Streptococcus chenjunshii]AXQ79411.1 type VII secretion protein EsaA [Streptococcus chenjunshii]RFU51132.1 type VII secretion protein EsaA [Streptococcus chenjunshii]RFU53230.1 type VII secretion protein EsaA [Streptococcus chenjunshii]
MKVNNFLQYGKYLLFIAAMLGAVLLLNIAVQKNNSSQENKRIDKLNVALVNEDQAVVSQTGERYQLGASYVKSLEKDDSNNWTVTSRGAAENGLETNRYQLMVVIPSNFSGKVLDIDSLTANQALVTYTVNANGNRQLETKANELGADIVDDLNSQLVNMYMASILGNLYTAQQNVLALSELQSANIGSYNNRLYQPVLGFPDVFSPLVSMADASFSANTSLLESLNASYNNSVNSANAAESRRPADSSAASGDDQIASPDSSIPGNTANNGLAMTNDELRAELQRLSESIQANQKLLGEKKQEENEITGPSETDIETDPSYNLLVEDLQKQIDSLEGELKTIESEISEETKTARDRIAEKLAAYYGKKAGESITLRDFLEKKGEKDYLDSIETKEEAVQKVINTLPTLDADSLKEDLSGLNDNQASFKYADYAKEHYGSDDKYQPSELGNRLKQAKADLEQAAKNSVDGKSGQAVYVYNNPALDAADENQAPNNNADDEKAEAKENSPAEPQTPNQEEEAPVNTPAAYKKETYRIIQTDNAGNAGTAVVSVDFPENLISVTSIAVNGQAVGDGSSASLADGNNNISVSYTYKERPANLDAVQNIVITVTPDKGSEVKQTIPVDLSPYVNDDYVKAVENYSALVQQVKDVYSTADAVIETAVLTTEGKEKSLNDFLDMDISDYLREVVTSSLTVAYGGGADGTSLPEIKKTKEDLQKNLDALTSNQTNLSSQITDLLAKTEKLQNDLDTGQPGGSSNTGNSQSSGRTSSASGSNWDSERAEQLRSLQAASASMRAESAQRVSSAQGVNNSFQTFKNEVDAAQASSQALSRTADDLMKEFDDELELNGDFVDAFSKVFNNAYNNGVANEALLGFLANPVKKSAQSAQATADVLRPFTWILLIEIITLFTAYVFGTQNIFQRLKDKYKVSSLNQADLISAGLLIGLSLLLGIILGAVSAQQLSIIRSGLPAWIFLNILLSLILVLSQYLLIKYFRAVGMGLALFMLLSYIYMTSAVGTTVAVNGGLALIKRLNFLVYIENLFANLFAGNMVSAGSIFILLLLAVAVIVLNVSLPSLEDKLRREAVKS